MRNKINFQKKAIHTKGNLVSEQKKFVTTKLCDWVALTSNQVTILFLHKMGSLVSTMQDQISGHLPRRTSSY